MHRLYAPSASTRVRLLLPMMVISMSHSNPPLHSTPTQHTTLTQHIYTASAGVQPSVGVPRLDVCLVFVMCVHAGPGWGCCLAAGGLTIIRWAHCNRFTRHALRRGARAPLPSSNPRKVQIIDGV
jgi:hypothetical protein